MCYHVDHSVSSIEGKLTMSFWFLCSSILFERKCGLCPFQWIQLDHFQAHLCNATVNYLTWHWKFTRACGKCFRQGYKSLKTKYHIAYVLYSYILYIYYWLTSVLSDQIEKIMTHEIYLSDLFPIQYTIYCSSTCKCLKEHNYHSDTFNSVYNLIIYD